MHADRETLTAMIDSGRTVLVDFRAAWCGPCLMMAPALERLAAQCGDGCLVAKVDTVRHAALAGEHGVRALPTLILFRDGAELTRYAGALSYGELRAWAGAVAQAPAGERVRA